MNDNITLSYLRR